MPRNKRFGELLDEGISSVAKRQRKTIAGVEREIADRLGYSPHTVQHWRRGNVPQDPQHVEELVRYCVLHGRVNREWTQSLLTQARYARPGGLLKEFFPLRASKRSRIFVCYERGVEPDQSVALQVSQALSEDYEVFFEQATSASPRWVAWVKTELERSNFLVVLLSAESVNNEVVLLELEMAHDLIEKQSGRPMLLPVRLAYRKPFQEPLSTYLDALNWAFWGSDEDTPRLIEDLKQALSGGALPIDEKAKAALLLVSEPSKLQLPSPLAQAARLKTPGGTMDPQSVFYVERDGDRIAFEAIRRRGVTITIKGPRQMGKSSLLVRVAGAAEEAGKRVVHLDFQLLKSSLKDADTFFRQFCAVLTYQVGVDERVDSYWGMPLPNPFRCTEYVGRYLLETSGCSLVLAMDEADTVFDTAFRTDFFGMLRTWHNNRAFEPIWKELDLVLVTSTEPYFLIDNLNQSPFNVGEIIELQDFSQEQVTDLNHRHGSPLTPKQESQLMALLNGHPYLVRWALYMVASQRATAADLFRQATDDRGPFGGHLRSLLLRLHDKEELIQGLRQVLRDSVCKDQKVFFRLQGAGLVRRERNAVLPRCQLYADFFQEHFDD